MADIGNTVMDVSIIVDMLTITAASKTIDSSTSVSADLPNITWNTGSDTATLN